MRKKKTDEGAVRKPKPKPKKGGEAVKVEDYCESRMPWDRAHGESDQAFAAFKAYRDMGLERTMPKVSQDIKKHVRLLHRWSVEWKWRERVEAWDTEQDRIERQQNLIEVRKMRKRHADTGMLLLGKALQRLARIDPSTLGTLALIKYIEVGAKLEARARGEPEEHTQQDLAVASGLRVVQTFTICGKTIEF